MHLFGPVALGTTPGLSQGQTQFVSGTNPGLSPYFTQWKLGHAWVEGRQKKLIPSRLALL